MKNYRIQETQWQPRVVTLHFPWVQSPVHQLLCYEAIQNENYIDSHSSSEYCFMSVTLRGKLYASHHFLIALPFTPYFRPICSNGVVLINFFNLSLLGRSTALRILLAHFGHLTALELMLMPQSMHTFCVFKTVPSANLCYECVLCCV